MNGFFGWARHHAVLPAPTCLWLAIMAGCGSSPSGATTSEASSKSASTALTSSSSTSSKVTSSSTPSNSTASASSPSAGCPGPDAPYTVAGNIITGKSGQEHFFRGLDRPTLEFDSSGGTLSALDYQTMQQWCANVVRIPLNQDFWLSDSPVYDANYAATVDTQVQWAEQAGLDVILDLHWSDRGDATVMQKCGCVTNSGSTACSGDCQQPMADSRSITFWGQLAAKYASDSQVLFELYNEPHDVAAAVWQSGGAASGSSLDNSSSSSFTVAGMQQLYNAVRAVAPDNLIIIGGLSYAYDLSAVSGNLPTGTNIIYNSHPYKTQYGTPSTADMESKFGFMAQNYPVIATEFGDTTTSQPAACDPTFYNSFISFANQQSTPSPSHKISWSAWAFFAGGCAFPSLISDSNYDTTAPGMAVEQALMAGP